MLYLSEQILEGTMNSDIIIGREHEKAIFKKLLASKQAEFLAIYGRRRVGKTYLIKNFFSKEKAIYFEQTGINGAKLKQQLAVFAESLGKAFYQGMLPKAPTNWMDAFKQLNEAIEKVPKNTRIILFFDELPWLCRRKSGFLEAIDHYWNTLFSNRSKLLLIVCGSAASWMIREIVYAKGGLHNRITAELSIQPFSLAETANFLTHLGVKWPLANVLQIYMAMGGIPYYLRAIDKKFSATQNINHHCFERSGILYDEFNKLFASLYDNSQDYVAIIRHIYRKKKGILREDLIKALNITDGGTINGKLKNLEEAGFITSFKPLWHKRRGTHYRVTDEYTLFYLTWIEPYKTEINIPLKRTQYWETMKNNQAWSTWSGNAYEAFCYQHIDQIIGALKLEALLKGVGEWRYLPKEDSQHKGVQIDLVIERKDDLITLCEIKYTNAPLKFTQKDADEFKRKRQVFLEASGKTLNTEWVLIANHKAHENKYYNDIFSRQITLEELV